MTKVLKIKIISILLTIFLLITGAFLVNSTSAKATVFVDDTNVLSVSSFKVVDGAQIRVTGNRDSDKGIRFVSELSVSDYNALTGKSNGANQFKNVEFGTFIMPSRYIEQFGPINFENCFGENAIYYSGKTPVAGKTRIQHLRAQPTLNQEGTAYHIRASIVNMLDENLDEELVGVGYIKAQYNGKNYYAFAKGAHENFYSVLNLSQDLFEKQGFDCENNEVMKDYMLSYINHYQEENGKQLQVSYSKEFFFHNNEEFVKNDELSSTETINVTADNFLMYLPSEENVEKEGYTYLSGFEKLGAKTSSLLRLNQPNCLQYYYQPKVDNLLFNYSMVNNDFGWTVQESNVDICNWKDEFSVTGEKGLYIDSVSKNTKFTFFYGTTLSNQFDSSHEDPTSTQGDFVGNNGVKLSNIVFPKTNQFSLWAYNPGTEDVELHIQFNVAKDSPNKTTETAVLIKASEIPQKVYFTINKEITTIDSITIHLDANNQDANNPNGFKGGKFYIDNLCWESDLYVDAQTFEVSKSSLVVDMGDLKGNLKSTKLTSEQLANTTVSQLRVRTLPEGTTVVVTQQGGKWKLTTEENTHYTYTATYSLNGKSLTATGYVLGRFKYSLANFDKTVSKYGVVKYDGITKELYGKYISYQNYETMPNEYFSNGLLMFGSFGSRQSLSMSINDFGIKGYRDGYSMRLNGGSLRITWGTIGIAPNFDPKDKVTKMCFFVYNPTDVEFDATANNLQHTAYLHQKDANGESKLDDNDPNTGWKKHYKPLPNIKPGWNYIELELTDEGYYLYSLITQIGIENSGSDTVASTPLFFDHYTFK